VVPRVEGTLQKLVNGVVVYLLADQAMLFDAGGWSHAESVVKHLLTQGIKAAPRHD